MQNYYVKLVSAVSDSFKCQMAANSLDIDVQKKSIHELSIDADLTEKWNVGLIVGASGSGKTTLAHKMFGDDCFDFDIDPALPVLDQFPEDWSYEDCQKSLNGIGLSQVPCWIRPVNTLSNGQTARAIAALQLARNEDFVVDEWTSVVDRTVAKSMSLCLGKHARKVDRQIVAVSCHYDVLEWLNPDWVIDCNKSKFTDRRLLWQNYERKEKLDFEIRPVARNTWRFFSKYHYLSENLPAGRVQFFGLFHGEDQIGFICYANYTPKRKHERRFKMHANRVVVHPDYVGLGLGLKMLNETAQYMTEQDCEVFIKMSAKPLIRACENSEKWRLKAVQRFQRKAGAISRQTGYRDAIKTYSFAFIPE